MIPPEGMQAIGEAISSLVEEGKCIQNGASRTLPPFRVTFEDNAVKVLFYLSDADVGKFEQFEVYTTDGKILFEKPGMIEKTEVEGLTVAFILKLQEVEN